MASESRSAEYKIIRIIDPVLTAIDGQVSFAISDNSLPSQVLHSRKVEYEPEGDYRWTGTSVNGIFCVNINKGPQGINGSVFNGNNVISGGVARYQILPLEGEEAVLVPLVPVVTTCTLGHNSSETAAAPAGSFGCGSDNPRHIDILFLLDAETLAYLGNGVNAHFDSMIAELEEVWMNSNISHTVDYSVDIFIPSFQLTNCKDSANEFSEDANAQSLREFHGADIVVYLPRNNFLAGNTACVADIGPLRAKAYSNIPIERSFDNYTFPHEIAHVYGANHNFTGTAGQFVPPNCAFGHRLEVNGVQNGLETALFNGDDNYTNIPYHSDPDINFDGVPTGLIDYSAGNNTVETNNAGQIRSAGKTVSNFSPQLGQSCNISANCVQGGCSNDPSLNCLLLKVEGDFPPSPATNTFQWNWSYDGLFLDPTTINSLGTGAELEVIDPVDTRCEYYFIQLVVSSNYTTFLPSGAAGPVIPWTTCVVSRRGNQCAVDPNSPDCLSSGAILSSSPQGSAALQKISKNSSIEIVENNFFQVFNIQGAYLGSLSHKEDVNTMNLNAGIYILRSQEGNVYKTEKILISND